jgi:NADPH:quinone reductase-like Zn-dependent oxidoreductase
LLTKTPDGTNLADTSLHSTRRNCPEGEVLVNVAYLTVNYKDVIISPASVAGAQFPMVLALTCCRHGG